MKSTTFETGMSDFHKLTTTTLQKTISKGNTKIIFYRDYKAFDQKHFWNKTSIKTNTGNYYRLFAVSVYISGNLK